MLVSNLTQKKPQTQGETLPPNNKQKMTERDLGVYTGTYLHTKCTVTDTQTKPKT